MGLFIRYFSYYGLRYCGADDYFMKEFYVVYSACLAANLTCHWARMIKIWFIARKYKMHNIEPHEDW